MSMLLELCEPFFQYMCRLNRSARKNAPIAQDSVRRDLEDMFKEMGQTAGGRPELAMQYEKVEMPLIFFADFIIKESNLPFASEWQELAKERGEHAGDEKFFDFLEETLAESGDAADERLLILHSCLGLGFTGFYTGQPEMLRRYMSQIASRLRGMITLDDASRVCPEAYECLDTSDLIEPPGKKMTVIGITAFLLLMVAMVTYFVLFGEAKQELQESLDTILNPQTEVTP